MRARIAVSALLAVGLLVGTSACTFITPVATDNQYDQSDGVSANVGGIQLRNLYVVTADGTDANLVGVMINSGTTTRTVVLQYTRYVSGVATPEIDRIPIAAGSVYSFGNPKFPQLVFRSVRATAGALFPVFFQYGDVSGKRLSLPVLSGAQATYSTLTPSPLPKPTSTPTSTPSPAPSPAG